MRKIIQISAAMNEYGISTHALCCDGKVFMSENGGPWTKLPPIPQDEVKEAVVELDINDQVKHITTNEVGEVYSLDGVLAGVEWSSGRTSIVGASNLVKLGGPQ